MRLVCAYVIRRLMDVRYLRCSSLFMMCATCGDTVQEIRIRTVKKAQSVVHIQKPTHVQIQNKYIVTLCFPNQLTLEVEIFSRPERS